MTLVQVPYGQLTKKPKEKRENEANSVICSVITAVITLVITINIIMRINMLKFRQFHWCSVWIGLCMQFQLIRSFHQGNFVERMDIETCLGRNQYYLLIYLFVFYSTFLIHLQQNLM